MVVAPKFQPGLKDAVEAQRSIEEVLSRFELHNGSSQPFALADHNTWDKAWKISSEHYVVQTTQTYAYGKSLATGLDQMAVLFQKLIKPDFVWTQKLSVQLFPDATAYNTFGNNGGDLHSSIYGSYFANGQGDSPVAATLQSNGTLVWIQVTHSASHQFLEAAYPGHSIPTWIEEGLASYFALHWGWQWGESEMRRYVEAKTWVPLKRVLTVPIGGYGAKVNQHFIGLGLLFRYLLHYREDTKSTNDADGVQQGPFAGYLRDVLAGKNVLDHPVHDLLHNQTKELEAALLATDWGG